MKYYNCKNTKGFQIDGHMSEDELNFDNTFCAWEMVTGPSGTYLRVNNPVFDSPIIDLPVSLLLESWYYDDNAPIGTGNKDEPTFENGFHLCSARLDGQVIHNFNFQQHVFIM